MISNETEAAVVQYVVGILLLRISRAKTKREKLIGKEQKVLLQFRYTRV